MNACWGSSGFDAASCKPELSQRLVVDEVRTVLAGRLVHVNCGSLDQTLMPVFKASISLWLLLAYRIKNIGRGFQFLWFDNRPHNLKAGGEWPISAVYLNISVRNVAVLRTLSS